MRVRGITALLAGVTSLSLMPAQVRALDATWTGPGSQWTTGTNWSSSPTVPDNTATFTNNGAPTAVTVGSASINTIIFTAGAPAYTFSSGTLTIGGTGIVNSASNGQTFEDMNLTFNNSSTAGSVGIQNGFFNFTVTFNNNSTAGNAGISNFAGGSVIFNDSSTAGHAGLSVAGGGATFNNNSSAANANIAIGSNGTVGVVNFNDHSTASNATITLGAQLGNAIVNFSGNSTAANAQITASADLRGNASVNFSGNSTGGNAAITADGRSTVDFSGTSGPNSDNKISVGSIAGSGFFAMGSNQLTVGSNGLSTEVSGVIGADGFICDICTTGSLVKVGAGTLTLSGMTTYAGATTVNGGVLEVDGSAASSSMITVNANATLTGTGTVGNTTINSGGIFAPGSGAPGSSMTVTGSLALQSGAIYVVMLNPSTASLANVSGAATLGGATVNATYANGSYISKQYTILTAGSVSGTFGSLVNSNLPTNFTTSLSYDPTHAYLNLALNFTPPPVGPAGPNFGSGLSLNQQSVANTLTSFFNATGGIPMAFGTLTPAGLSQVSGESATGSQQTTFDAMTQFMSVMTDPFVAGRGNGGSTGANAPGYAEESYGVSAYAPKDTPRSQSERDAYAAIYRKAPPAADPFLQRWSVWAAGFGGSQSTDGNAALGSNNTTSSIAGTAVGADYRISPFTIAGFALAGGGTSFSVANGGSAHSDLFQAGAFIRHTVGAAYISGALAYGWQDITTNRTVSVAGIDQLRAEFNANAYSGRVEGGYRFVAPWAGGIGITPYAAGQFTTFDLPAYAESVVSGTGNFVLAYGARDVTDTRSELGIRTDKSWAMPNSWSGAILTLRGRLAWAHDFDPDRSIGATFQTLPGASFVVNGAAQASDSALTTASIEMKWLNGWSGAATFEGEFSSVTSSYAGKGVVRYTW
jgi:autotransporter-associated beta strand protein